jgi:hypothetical protein
MTDLLNTILPRLNRGDSPDSRWPDKGGEYWALCPFHADTHPDNFSVSERGYKCFACDKNGGLYDLAQHLGVQVCARAAGGSTPPSPPITLDDYAKAKNLPVDFLQSLGLQTVHIGGQPAVKMPYYDLGGTETATRFRHALSGDTRFRWRKGSKMQPYGLWKLNMAKSAGFVVVVEGESDTQTLWHYGLPALGAPGADTWKAEWADYLTGLDVYVWQEPDQGGNTLVGKVGASLPGAKVLTPRPGLKDVSEAHLLGEDVTALIASMRAGARPYSEVKAGEQVKEAARMREACGAIPNYPDILGEVAKVFTQLGLVGEDVNAKLLYLAVSSRLQPKPVSVAIKGPSSGGKSFTCETVLRTFPASAYYALSAMSEHALAYSQEPLSHRMLVVYEMAGLNSDFGSYLVRSLLSEGRVRYETVEKGSAMALCPSSLNAKGLPV